MMVYYVQFNVMGMNVFDMVCVGLMLMQYWYGLLEVFFESCCIQDYLVDYNYQNEVYCFGEVG